MSASTNSRTARTPRDPADSAVALAIAASVTASANGNAISWSAEIHRSPTAPANVPSDANGAADDACPTMPSANPPPNASSDHVVNDRKGTRDRSGLADVTVTRRSLIAVSFPGRKAHPPVMAVKG